MENELTFRTSVGGYRKDEVIEYVENLNDEMFHMKKTYEDEIGRLRMKVQELETLLQQEKSEAAQLEGEQHAKIENLEQENTNLKENLDTVTKSWSRCGCSTKRQRNRETGKPEKNKILRRNWQKKFYVFARRIRSFGRIGKMQKIELAVKRIMKQ